MTVVAVVGLGYVGLPLAVEFGKQFRPSASTSSQPKIDAYRARHRPDGRGRAPRSCARRARRMHSDAAALGEADFIIVAVPTPVDDAHQPDFAPLVGASEAVGPHLKPGAIVVFESTVYPGATEEICVPVIERHSGMHWKRDFFVGYSPERINPGDREHTLDARSSRSSSGDTPETLERVAELYGSDRQRRASTARRQHQGRRGREGHREHAARPQHRADERAGADLPQASASTRAMCSRRRAPSGTSCRSGPAWSAATASASTPTT